MPRPRKHDRAATLKAVCRAIASGQLVKDACKDVGVIPDQIRDWAAESEEFSALYARAREAQSHALAEKAMDISNARDEDAWARVAEMVEAVHGAEESDKRLVINALVRESVQRDRLRVDTLKWYTSKIAPKLYGDRMDVTSGGDKLASVAVVMLPPEG